MIRIAVPFPRPSSASAYRTPQDKRDMADAGKVEELLKDETIQAVAALEPVALDAKKLVTEALEEAGNDLDTARAKIAEKVADTGRKE